MTAFVRRLASHPKFALYYERLTYACTAGGALWGLGAAKSKPAGDFGRWNYVVYPAAGAGGGVLLGSTFLIPVPIILLAALSQKGGSGHQAPPPAPAPTPVPLSVSRA